jgi:hypothetical protein
MGDFRSWALICSRVHPGKVFRFQVLDRQAEFFLSDRRIQ